MNRYNDAINVCLMAIGEHTIPGTSITGHPEAELADLALDEALREVMSYGYQFNTDEDWDLVPDASGYIAIPAGALAVDASQTSSDYIVKNDKLYDKAGQTFIFTSTVQVDVTWEIAFDDLNIIVQNYIVALAKTKLYTRVVGVDSMYSVLKQEEQDTKSLLLREDISSGDYSIFDDIGTSRVKNRTQNPTAL